jgi:hypothetical protein
MELKYKQYIIQYFLPVLLILFYFSEGISKLYLYQTSLNSSVPAIIKLITFVICLASTITNLKYYKWIIILSFTFIIGQIFTFPSFNFKVITNVVKYIFPLVIMYYFYIFKTDDRGLELTFKTLDAIILLNSILIIIGFAFEIQSFESYRGPRFGYNGLLLTSATGSYFYLVAYTFYLIKYKSSFLKSWKVYLVILSGILVGTKALILILFCFLSFWFFYFFKKKYAIFFLIFLGFTISVFSYYFFFKWGVFNKLYFENGLLSSILSYRNDLLIKHMIPYIQDNWGFVNYLFGGINNISLRPQMAIFDLVFVFGFIGASIYLFLYFKLLVIFKKDIYYKFFISILSVILFFSGNYFLNASVAIYILVLREYFMYNEPSKVT